jgi:hypothetical protein
MLKFYPLCFIKQFPNPDNFVSHFEKKRFLNFSMKKFNFNFFYNKIIRFIKSEKPLNILMEHVLLKYKLFLLKSKNLIFLNFFSKIKMNQNFMRKIPAGAEASNVLVGEVDFLEYQFSAFIRLAKSVVLGDLTEVPVPTRFLFVILGPKGNIAKYHEIGRSISTLMSDEVNRKCNYI